MCGGSCKDGYERNKVGSVNAGAPNVFWGKEQAVRIRVKISCKGV